MTGPEIQDLKDRIEVLENHIARLDECIMALAAMSNSPLGPLTCNRFIEKTSDGRPQAGTSIE